MNNKKIESKIKLTPKTAYLVGVIIGDGHIVNSSKSKTDHSTDYQIRIDISDKEYLVYLSKVIKSLIYTKSQPQSPKIYGNRMERLYFQVRNKRLFKFLSEEMEIPKGAKSSIVFVPNKIKNSSKEIKSCFLAGYFDTDGGFRGNSLGFTTASQILHKGTIELLNEFGIKHLKERWTNKRYNKEFYGIRIYKGEIDKFLKLLPLQNTEKLERINKRFKCEDAGVAKRDRFSQEMSKLRSLL